MIAIPGGARIWMTTGHTDMRRGMHGLALQVQQGLQRDPHAGDLYLFRGRRGDLVKILWHDGVGLSLYAKRLDRGRFIWPAAVDGVPAGGDRLAQSAHDVAPGCSGIIHRKRQKTGGLLKNGPLVAGYGWGRNDTSRFCDPVSHGMVNWESKSFPESRSSRVARLALRQPPDAPGDRQRESRRDHRDAH